MATYVYDARTNAIAQVTQEQARILKQQDQISEGHPELRNLVEASVLSTKLPDKVAYPIPLEGLQRLLSQSIRTITLVVTEACNLRCNYCVYKHKYGSPTTLQRMNWDVARGAVDFLMSHSSKVDEVSIGFYGGEPLLRYDLLKQVVAYVHKGYSKRPVLFHLTTNGVLLKDEILDFLAKSGFQVSVSLDGPRAIHDRYRKFETGIGTYDVIQMNLERVREKYPEFYNDNVSFLAVAAPPVQIHELAKFAEECNGKLTITSYSSGLDDDELEADQIQSDYWDWLTRAYIQLRTTGECGSERSAYLKKMFDPSMRNLYMRMRSAGTSSTAFPSGTCVPGLRRLLVRPNGSLAICERVDERQERYILGSIYDGIDIGRVEALIKEYELSCAKCNECWALRFCTRCFRNLEDIDQVCQMVRRNLNSDLTLYCTILERNSTAFFELERQARF